jgi:hypothetical protein
MCDTSAYIRSFPLATNGAVKLIIFKLIVCGLGHCDLVWAGLVGKTPVEHVALVEWSQHVNRSIFVFSFFDTVTTRITFLPIDHGAFPRAPIEVGNTNANVIVSESFQGSGEFWCFHLLQSKSKEIDGRCAHGRSVRVVTRQNQLKMVIHADLSFYTEFVCLNPAHIDRSSHAGYSLYSAHKFGNAPECFEQSIVIRD